MKLKWESNSLGFVKKLCFALCIAIPLTVRRYIASYKARVNLIRLTFLPPVFFRLRKITLHITIVHCEYHIKIMFYKIKVCSIRLTFPPHSRWALWYFHFRLANDHLQKIAFSPRRRSFPIYPHPRRRTTYVHTYTYVHRFLSERRIASRRSGITGRVNRPIESTAHVTLSLSHGDVRSCGCIIFTIDRDTRLAHFSPRFAPFLPCP